MGHRHLLIALTVVMVLALAPNAVDAALATPAIGDLVWHDLNHNGIQDAGEPGLPGVEVQLYNDESVHVATTSSDANGHFLFSGVAPDIYKLRFIAPAGYIFSPYMQGGDRAVDNDASSPNGWSTVFFLDPDEVDLTWDAGFYLSEAKVGDRAWHDLDRDGIQDAGEPGLAGVMVRLYDEDDILVSSTVTDTNGNYQFTVPGTTPTIYKLRFIAPAGYMFSPYMQGDHAVDNDASSPNGWTTVFYLDPGEIDLNWDAGLYLSEAKVGDRAWHDLDRDGIQDAGEPGLAGVMVRLYDEDDILVSSTVTDGSGNYQFTVPGTTPTIYKLRFIAPAGYMFSPYMQGGDHAVDNDASSPNGWTTVFYLDPGEIDLDWDAGLCVSTATFGDFVWHDLDRDGIQDAGEPGLEGVYVELLDGDNNSVDNTTTDVNGLYLFTGIEPGTYKINFTAPSGYVFSPIYQGSDRNTDSDCDAAGRTTVTILAAGDVELGWDAGLFVEADLSISKHVYEPWLGGAEGDPCFGFTLAVSNLGPGDATGVTVSDVFPTGLTPVVQAGDPYLVVGQQMTWLVGDLAAGHTTSVVVSFSADGPSTYTNTATVNGDQQDPEPANNTATTGVSIGGLELVKYYDANLDSMLDCGELELSEWQFHITGGNGDWTQAWCGVTANTDMLFLAGTAVDVLELQSGLGWWVATTETSASTTIIAGQTQELSFGNVCLGPGGGHSKGFWSNRNGLIVFASLDNPASLLNSYNLVLENGEDLILPNPLLVKNAKTYETFTKWLSTYSRAKNMSLMLSAQLAAMVLNVDADFVDPDALIYAGCLLDFALDREAIGLTPLGFITVADAISLADDLLGCYPVVLADHPQRNLLECVKNALDWANCDLSFLQAEPCCYGCFVCPVCLP